jgi:hypothetical protein
VEKSDGCWLWLGSRHRIGHGYASLNGRVQYAHRVSWQLTHGAIPDGQVVCHKCDNPPCVNPEHLFVGTQGDNMRDAASKGRLSEAQRRDAKLSEASVRQIKSLLAAGVSQQSIAASVGVSRTCISAISTGRNWKDIA